MNSAVKRIHVFADHSAVVYALARGRTKDSFFSASGDRFVVEWNTSTLAQNSFAVKLEQPAYSVLFIEEFQLLVVGNSTGGLHIIDTESKNEIRYFTLHTNGIYDLLWDAQRTQLFAAGGDGFVSVWSLPSFELIRNIPFSTEKIRRFALSPDREQIAIACGDGMIRIIEPVFFNELYTIRAHEDGATAVAWHPQKPVLVSGGKDAYLRLYHSGENFRSLMNIPAHNFAIYAIAFSPGGKYCATVSRDKTIKLWNSLNFDPVVRLDAHAGGHSHSVNDLLWTDDRHFVSAGDDRRIIFWELQNSNTKL